MDWLFGQIQILSKISYYLVQVVHLTVLISAASYLLALVVGLLLAVARISPNRFLRGVSGVYINVLRGVPLLVWIFFLYYGLGQVINLGRETAGILAVGLCYAAYMAEIFRSGIEAISYGQHEAALSLGMTRRQALWHIILPQAKRVVVPPAANEFIACLKDSSLVSIIGLRELTRAGREYANQYFLDFQTWLVVGCIYLILTLTLTRAVRRLERRYAVHGFGVRRHAG